MTGLDLLRRPLSWALLLFVLLGVAPADAQSPDQVVTSVTLEEAIRLALESSPEMVQAVGSTRTARAAERTARGAYIPTLSLSSGSSLNGFAQGLPGGDGSNANGNFNLGLTTGVDVYTGGRRGAQQTQAQAETFSADATLVEREFSVILQTKRSYFDVLRATELIRVSESRVGRADEALTVATNRERLGTATRSDRLRSQLELTRARQSLLESQNQFNAAAYTLGALVGSDSQVAAREGDALAVTPLAMTPAQIVAAAVELAPAIRTAEATVRSNEAAIAVARAQYLPSVRLSSGYSMVNQDPALWNGSTNWNFGVSVSLPILNGYGRDESVERATVQTQVANSQLNDAQRAARADAQRLLGNLQLAEQKIAMAEESVLVAEEDLRVQQDRYRLGASTSLDQIQSQENLVQAQTDVIAARFDYQITLAELESLLGREL